MTDFLEQLVAERRADVAEQRARQPLEIPKLEGGFMAMPGSSFLAALRRHEHIAVIAEVKRTSPALGRLASSDFDVVAQARRYVDAGASAISVLTEPRHWDGSLEDISRIRAELGPRVPILCKDVIVDEYQVVAAKEAGANAVLLIAEALTDEEITRLSTRAQSLVLGVLLEAHERDAFERVVRLGHIIGVNARNLRRPEEIDPHRIHDLAPLVQDRHILVAESGIGSVDDVRRLPSRVDAVLVGTALMRATDPGALIREIASIERVTA